MTTRHHDPKDPFFLFSTETQALPVQQTMTMEWMLHQIGSCRSAADDANMSFVPTKIAHHVLAEASQNNPQKKNIPTELIVPHGSCIVCAIPTFMSWSVSALSCHVLSGHNVLYGVQSPACLASQGHGQSSHSTIVIRKRPPQS